MNFKTELSSSDSKQESLGISDFRQEPDAALFVLRHCPVKDKELVSFLTHSEQAPGLLDECREWLFGERGKSGRTALSMFVEGHKCSIDVFESYYHLILWICLFAKFDINKSNIGDYREAVKQTVNGIQWLLDRNDLVYGERMSISYLKDSMKVAGPNPPLTEAAFTCGMRMGGTYCIIQILDRGGLDSILQKITVIAVNEPRG